MGRAGKGPKSSVSTQCATLLDLKAPTPTRAVKASLSRCLLAVTGGAEPTRFFNSLPCRASKNKQSVCGAVWKRGNIAYRCLDCEVDANSAVCVDCGHGQLHPKILEDPRLVANLERVNARSLRADALPRAAYEFLAGVKDERIAERPYHSNLF